MISPRSNVVSAVLKGVTALALRWEEAVSETRRGFPTCKWAADQNLQLAGTLLFGGDLEKQMNVDQRRSRHCGFSLMSALYLVLMRRSNKKKQPNHFDFIIIVVEGPLMSFSCQRRENKYKYFTDTVEYKNHDGEILDSCCLRSQEVWLTGDGKEEGMEAQTESEGRK